jgi:hypothetical protein
MKNNKSVSRYNIVQKTESRRISQPERMKIKSDFMKHLASPVGTLENYPQKTIVKALMKHYPGTLDEQITAEYTQSKVNDFMNVIYDLTVSNKKIYANPFIIKMIVNHIRGKDESSSSLTNQQIVIQNWFPAADSGKPTLPEPKIKIADVDKE